MWKAFAPANAARNGLFAAQLAKLGVTGPVLPFKGVKGFEKQVSGPLELEKFGDGTAGYMINKTFVKTWPVQYNTQAGIQAALALREKISTPDEIAGITIDISDTGRILAADTSAKWDPQTRETADHSLPYIVVSALLDGEVTRQTFDRERFRNPDKLALMRRVEVRADPEFTESYPRLLSVRVAISAVDGRHFVEQVDIPKGHPLDPLTDSELGEKYRKFAAPHMGTSQVQQSVEALWELETATNLGELMALFEVKQGP
ncbi:MAG: MmgE/PrpD family protein [Hyphomicrobiales bacterium]|nr:MmgE/PrpD family protein [Hyphomicrobiales bacterium]